MTKHTANIRIDPPPWIVDYEDDPTSVRSATGSTTAAVFGPFGNARLIAAAPELLKALDETVTRFERCMVHAGSDPTYAHEATRDARSAIAKARGETD